MAFPFVEVVWDDATVTGGAWVGLDDISDPERVISRGWLVKENEAALYLAASVANEDMEEHTVGNVMTIPVGMVITRRVLRITKPAKEKAKPIE